MRIHQHPILDFGERKTIRFSYNGQTLEGLEGDTIASALHAHGVKKLSESIHLKRPRGFYCAIGNCASCNMVVNGEPNVRTCITPLEDGMDVRLQEGKGRIR
ncbi:MAG: (2Fe-2S)-binding protein [Acholeplasmatales bacterium]|nr:MAG: (2Fe-2S)-binding protein [Acholeplasmatales bacterium]